MKKDFSFCRMHMCWLLLLCTISFVCGFYMDPNGSDNGVCDLDNPCASVQGVLQAFGNQTSALTIYIQDGTFGGENNTNIVFPNTDITMMGSTEVLFQCTGGDLFSFPHFSSISLMNIQTNNCSTSFSFGLGRDVSISNISIRNGLNSVTADNAYSLLVVDSYFNTSHSYIHNVYQLNLTNSIFSGFIQCELASSYESAVNFTGCSFYQVRFENQGINTHEIFISDSTFSYGLVLLKDYYGHGGSVDMVLDYVTMDGSPHHAIDCLYSRDNIGTITVSNSLFRGCDNAINVDELTVHVTSSRFSDNWMTSISTSEDVSLSQVVFESCQQAVYLDFSDSDFTQPALRVIDSLFTNVTNTVTTTNKLSTCNIDNSTFTNCGTLQAAGSAGSIKNCLFDSSSTHAVDLSSGSWKLTNVTFSHGVHTAEGIGALILRYVTYTIEDCHFNNNSASSLFGGAITAYGSNGVIIDSLFNGNSADIGGAVYAISSHCTVDNCEFHDNTATDAGGAIFANFAYLDVQDSTFRGSTTQGNGGAISFCGVDESSGSEVSNSIFSKNSASNGAAVACQKGCTALIDFHDNDVTSNTNTVNHGKDYYCSLPQTEESENISAGERVAFGFSITFIILIVFAIAVIILALAAFVYYKRRHEEFQVENDY